MLQLRPVVASASLVLLCGVALGLQAQPTSSTAPDWTKGGQGGLPAISTKPVPVEQLANQGTLTDEIAKLSDIEKQYHQHVTTLSNPFFEGRAPGTRGNALAAEYIEFWFKGIGLKPGFNTKTTGADGAEVVTIGDTYRQAFSAGRVMNVTRQDVKINTNAGEVALAPGVDFNPLGSTGTARAEGPVVFVGYGITNGEGGYNSFEGMADDATLEGKVALLLRFEPMDDKGQSRWNQGGGWTNASGLRNKLAAVARRKPAAIVLVNPPGADDPRAGRLESTQGTRAGGAPFNFPVIMVSEAQADALAGAAGKTLMDLRQAADAGGGVLDLGGASMAIDVAVEMTPTMTDNVGGVLPGKGALADQFIVIGAHYDHVGYGGFSSRAGARGNGLVHPGADDNASGTAGLLIGAQELAKQYSALPADASVRSIMFVTFSAEESGLLGARHMIRNSPIEANRVTAMLNMDMIGRVRNNRLEMSGTGSAEGFEALLKPLNEASGLTVRMLPGGSGPSDHAVFYGASIPVLHIFSGLHAAYHMPEDHWWTINTQGAVKAVGLLTSITSALATRAEPLAFKEAEGPSIDMEDPSRADNTANTEPAGDTAPPRPAPVRIRFGIAPDNYDDGLPGVPVGEVYAGTSAADAGIKAGDRLIKWNGQNLKGVVEWMPMLSAHKPGDVVDVTLVRDKQEMTVKVTLKGRDRGDR